MNDIIKQLQAHANQLPAVHYSVPLLREAITELEELESQVAKLERWIPITERTPRNAQKEYYIKLNSTKTKVAWWINWGGKIGWNWLGGYNVKAATHWMEIPILKGKYNG